MRTIETVVYSFSELSEKAQENAINNLSDINVDYDWWDSVYEDAERIGLRITSFDLDRNRHAKGEFTLSPNEVAQNIFNEHGESCDTYKTAKDFMTSWEPVFSNYMNEEHPDYESGDLEQEMMEMEDNFLESLLEDYSIMLQNEYEYLTSNEAIIETIEENDYEFTEEGELI